jgi:hypothetical protein
VCVHSLTMESTSHRHLHQDPNQKQKVVMKIPKFNLCKLMRYSMIRRNQTHHDDAA